MPQVFCHKIEVQYIHFCQFNLYVSRDANINAVNTEPNKTVSRRSLEVASYKQCILGLIHTDVIYRLLVADFKDGEMK